MVTTHSDKVLGQTKLPTTPLEPLTPSWHRCRVRSLLEIDPMLIAHDLADRGKLRLIVGRSSSADIQIVDRYVSRQHCTLHCFEGRVRLAECRNAQPTYVNGVQVGRNVVDLGPWQFVRVGETTLMAVGAERPQDGIILPASDPLEQAVQALAVYAHLNTAARALDMARNTLRRRLQRSETGRALLAARPALVAGNGQEPVPTAVSGDLSDGVPVPIP